MPRHSMWVVVAALCLPLTLAGCTSSKDATQPLAQSSATTTALQAEDALACDAVGTTISRLTAATAKWSPQTQPFDPQAETEILHFANDLAVEGDQATSEGVQAAVHASALAFADLSTAMSHHDRAMFDTAISRTKVEYAALKQVCSL